MSVFAVQRAPCTTCALLVETSSFALKFISLYSTAAAPYASAVFLSLGWKAASLVSRFHSSKALILTSLQRFLAASVGVLGCFSLAFSFFNFRP